MKNNQKTRLAELIGIILGDGHLHKTQNNVTIVGSTGDFYYYKYHVIPLIISLFKVNPQLKKRNDRNAYYIYFNSKEVINFLSNKLGLVRGNKTRARIPLWIFETDDVMKSFLRGIFDTDGCLKFSKQTKSINYYPRLQLSIKKSNIINDVGSILIDLGIKFGRWEEQGRGVWLASVIYHISGVKNLETWMKIIGFNNPVHKTKYLFWKKYGYYIPRSSLQERLKSLNLKIEDVFPKMPRQ